MDLLLIVDMEVGGLLPHTNQTDIQSKGPPQLVIKTTIFKKQQVECLIERPLELCPTNRKETMPSLGAGKEKIRRLGKHLWDGCSYILLCILLLNNLLGSRHHNCKSTH